MAYTVTINGVSRALQQGWRIEDVINGRATLTTSVSSTDASWRPSLGQEIILNQNGSPIFGGYISQLSEMSRPSGLSLSGIITRITAADYNGLVERRFVTESFPEQSLKNRLTTIVANYLDDYGVSLAGGQVTGPTLPARDYDHVSLVDVMNETMLLTGASGATPYVWRISPSKVLSAFLPASSAAPFSISDSTRHLIDDVFVEPSRDNYANRILLKAGAAKVIDKTDTFTGDGVEDTFELNYPIVYNAGGVGYGYVTTNGVIETLSNLGGGATWEYDPSSNAITRTSPPGNGHAIVITYPAQFPITVIAEDAAEIVANGIWERAYADETIEDRTVAEDVADSILATAIELITHVYYRTTEDGLAPGQTQSINLTRRAINATFLIEELAIENESGNIVRSAVKAVSESRRRPGFRDIYKQWAGTSGAGAGAGVIVSGGGGGGGGTAVIATPFYLGGSRNTSQALDPADWTPVVDFVAYVAAATFTGRVRATIWTRNAGVTVTARLRNVTDSTTVGTSSGVTSQTPTDVTILGAIVTGKTYRLEIQSNTNNSGVFGIGVLEAA